MKFLTNYIFVFAALFGAALGIFGIYRWGYKAAETEYLIQLSIQHEKIKHLEQQEKQIEKEIIVEYVDRVRTVTRVEQKILEVTGEILQHEANVCPIGTNFIWLHNQSASNQAVSSSTSSVDAVTGKSEDTTQ